MEKDNLDELHISVLLKELVESVDIFKDRKNIIVDATLWLAWHAIEIIKKLNKWDIFVWFDADERNLILAEKRIKDKSWKDINFWSIDEKKINIILLNSNFLNLKKELEKRGIEKITWIYYDLWISSLHVDEAERWFSINLDWPLDMRFDNKKWKNAKDIINSYKQEDLRRIFLDYGEEKRANLIAKKIVEKRKKKKFETTKDLANTIDEVTKDKKTKIKIFQAIRIETNNELENIKKSLTDAINILEKNSKIFVISFHSLEDRIVKNIFRKETRDCICQDLICSCKHKKSLKILTKKPIIPSQEEQTLNRRSRSAKARLAEKL